MAFSTTSDVVDFVFESFNRVGHLSGPDSITRHPELTAELLDRIGLGRSGRPAALIAGSKGKGSTAVLTARLLQAAGHRVGLITSPHLRDFRERIRLDGRAISEADLIASADAIEPPARAILDRLPPPTYLSPTGLVVALGLAYFERAGATALVIEAGRGGTHDDTNVVPHQVAVLTPIYLEHREQLGASIAEIAASKAGIIGPGATAVIGGQSAEARLPIARRCDEIDASSIWLGRDFEWSAAEANQQIRVRTPRAAYDALPVPLLGRHQADNLAVALTAAEALEPALTQTDRAVLRSALVTVRWPGRLEVLGRHPLIVADGAINEESARLALQALAGQLRSPVVAIVAVPADKDWDGVCRALAPAVDDLILTETSLNRTLHYPADALERARCYLAPERLRRLPDSAAALAEARRLSASAGTILILGTQSLIAEAQGLLGRDCLNLW